MNKGIGGFTIVELLIVVVVIAILASISTVAYTGIQGRAENAKTVAAVSSYVKALKIYASQEGQYPMAGWSCFGQYPGSGCALHSGVTPTCNGNGSVPNDVTFNAEMNKVFGGTAPQPSTQSLNCGGSSYRGAYYYGPDGQNIDIRYFLKGSQPCDGVGGIAIYNRFQSNDATLCSGNLPTP